MPTPPDLPPLIARLVAELRRQHPELEAASEYARRSGTKAKGPARVGTSNVWELLRQLIEPKLAAEIPDTDPLVRRVVALAAWLGPDNAGPPPTNLCDYFLDAIDGRPGTEHQALDYLLLGGAREAEPQCAGLPAACWGGRRPCGNALWDERWPHAIQWLAIVAEEGLRNVRKRLKDHVRGFGGDPHEHLVGEKLGRRRASQPSGGDWEEAENLSGDALLVAVEFTSQSTEWRPGPKYEQYQDVRCWDPAKGNARKFLQWAYQGDDSAEGSLPSQSFVSSLYGRLLRRRQEVEAGDLAFYICRSEACVAKREDERRANQMLEKARELEVKATVEFGQDSSEAAKAKANLKEAEKRANEACKAAAFTQREFDGKVDEAIPNCPSCGQPSFWISMKNLLYVPGVYLGRKFRGCNAGKEHRAGKEWPHYFTDGVLRKAGFKKGRWEMRASDKVKILQGRQVSEEIPPLPLLPGCCPQHQEQKYCSQASTMLMVQAHLGEAPEIPDVERETDNEND